MPMNLLEVYNIFYEKVAVLNDNTTDCAKNIGEDFRTNEICAITFELPVKSSKWQYVMNENLVKWKNEYYIIKNTNFAHSKDKKMITVQCKHLSCSLASMVRTEVTDIGYSVEVLVKSQLGYQKIYDGNGDWTGTFQEDLNTYPTDTGWRYGGTDIDLSICRSIESKEQSVFSNLLKIAELYGASLVFESDYVDYGGNHLRMVSIKKNVLNRGIQIRTGKNLKSVSLHYDSTEIITKLYPFGKVDSDGIEVSILGALDGNGVEVTQSWLESYAYYKTKYPTLTDAYIQAHPELFLHEMTWRVEDYSVPQDLYDEAVKKMAIVCQPKVTCNIEGLDLSIFPQYFIDSPVLNETITIIDEDLSLTLQAKVIAISRNSSNPLAMQISISNEIEYNSIVKQLVDTSDTVHKVISPTQQIYGQYIKEATIDNVHLKDATITKAKIEKAVVDELEASTANITTLSSDTAHIKEVFADALEAGQIVAGSTIIAQGAIGDAQIEKMSANKLDAGTIDTAIITVQGTNGRLKIKGNRLQVFDENAQHILFERVALGDVNNDGTIFGFRVRGADGTTLLIDETGVKREGITDGAITNTKIADDANISASKIDIESVVTAINNGILTIDGSKIYMDEKTLDVLISEMQQSQTSQGTTVSNQSTQISALSDKIDLKAEKTELTAITGKFTEYDTKIADVNTKADGVTISITDITTRVDGAETQISTINEYFDFLETGLKIGRTNDPLTINISNSEMDFLDKGKVVAYVNGQKMYIDSLDVLSSLLVGVHRIEKYDNNITLIKWAGGGA